MELAILDKVQRCCKCKEYYQSGQLIDGLCSECYKRCDWCGERTTVFTIINGEPCCDGCRVMNSTEPLLKT